MTFDERRLRWLLGFAVVLLGAGFYAFIVRGASQPARPTLGPVEPTTTSTSLVEPGDPQRVPLPGFSELAIKVDGPSGTSVAWCLLAALTEQQRNRGLMTVTDLHGYSGMAFVFDGDVQDQFYMRNTPMPLSIAWINSSGSLVSTADMAPCADKPVGCPNYAAAGPYRLAIEAPKGRLASLGLVPGSHTTITGACTPRSGA
jgi:uncharacterized membrane protein (UPF0127 family)